jgi:hypothetical protein
MCILAARIRPLPELSKYVNNYPPNCNAHLPVSSSQLVNRHPVRSSVCARRQIYCRQSDGHFAQLVVIWSFAGEYGDESNNILIYPIMMLFRGAYCLQYQMVMMEAVSTSETSANFYQTTQRNNPEDSHLHTDISLNR